MWLHEKINDVVRRRVLDASTYSFMSTIVWSANTSSSFSHMALAMSLKRKAVDIAADAAKKPKQNGSITAFFGAPKVTPSTGAATGSASFVSTTDATAPATTPIKFDKDAWVAKLSDEQKDLLKLEIDTLHESWLGALKDEITSPEFLSLKRFLKSEYASGKKVFPPQEDIYSWSVFFNGRLM